jgi:hypothetical protein
LIKLDLFGFPRWGEGSEGAMIPNGEPETLNFELEPCRAQNFERRAERSPIHSLTHFLSLAPFLSPRAGVEMEPGSICVTFFTFLTGSKESSRDGAKAAKDGKIGGAIYASREGFQGSGKILAARAIV